MMFLGNSFIVHLRERCWFNAIQPCLTEVRMLSTCNPRHRITLNSSNDLAHAYHHSSNHGAVQLYPTLCPFTV